MKKTLLISLFICATLSTPLLSMESETSSSHSKNEHKNILSSLQALEQQLSKEIFELHTDYIFVLYERDTIYNNALESGAIYTILLREKILQKTITPTTDSIDFQKLVTNWKAFPVTKQILRMDKKLNALDKKRDSIRELRGQICALQKTQKDILVPHEILEENAGIVVKYNDLLNQLKDNVSPIDDGIDDAQAIAETIAIFTQRTNIEIGEYIHTYITTHNYAQQNANPEK